MIPTKIAGEITSFTLDMVRFLCSQGVLLGHLFYFTKIDAGPLNGLASFCVLIFFVLSGFLISTSLFHRLNTNEKYSFGSYFKDRFFRIYPPFVASLVFVLVLDVIGFLITSQPFSISRYAFNFVINLLMLQEFPLATYINEHYMIEFFRFRYFGSNLPLWTIGIEWWMYMFFGVVVYLMSGRMRFRAFHYIILAFLTVTPLYFMLKAGRMERGLSLYWFLGALITLIAGKVKPGQAFSGTLYCGLVLLIAGLLSFSTFGFITSVLLFSTGLVLMVSVEKTEKFTFNSSLKNAGKFLAGYSYSLYLIHYPILYFAIHVYQPESKISTLLMLCVIVNIIAIIFAKLFEHSSTKLKRAYENYRSGNH
jgi:peptidoglycan/LPS O-acetylase OafA/YrhL